MHKYRIITLTLELSLIAAFTEGIGELNEYCRVREDCNSIGYFCYRNFTCQCQSPAYIPNRSRTKCIGMIDQKCKYDEHCIEGAYCYRQKTCQCKEEYYPNDDNTMCLSAGCETTATTSGLTSLALILLVTLLGLG